jgi:hypothetical protein
MRALFLAILLVGCTAAPAASPVPERFLSQDQDDEFRQRCAATGCVVVPFPIWREILQRLQQQGV